MSYAETRYGNPFGFRVTPWVKRLLIANAAVFLVTFAFSFLLPYLAFLPAAAIGRPWTVLTYMFVHGDLFHLLFNMLALFFFGPPLEERWGSREFLKFYLICGVAGALLSVIFWNQPIIGASAAVYGVMTAFAIYWPDNPIYIWGIFPVKAKWLVGFLVAISLFFTVTGAAAGIAHLAHLGGAAAAFLYIKSSWGPSPFGPRPPRAKPQKSRARKVVDSVAGVAREAREARSRRPQDSEEERLLDDIDRILEKISSRGMDSLTAEERSRLDEASRRYRTS